MALDTTSCPFEHAVFPILQDYWAPILQQTARQIWRWKQASPGAKPYRHSPLKKTDEVELRGDQWWLKGETDKQIVIERDIPIRIIRGWQIKGNLNTEEFIDHWQQDKVGCARDHVRKMAYLLGTEQKKWDKLHSMPLEHPEAQVCPTPLQPDAIDSPPPLSTKALLLAAPSTWTTGLRVESSWKRKARPEPAISAEDKGKVATALRIIREGKAITFVTGAGISVAAGNFRSAGGVFSKMGTSVFAGYGPLHENVKNHHIAMGTLARYAQHASQDPTPFHHMLAYLAEQRTRPLHRIATQNIDGLEDSFEFLQVANPKIKAIDGPLTVYLHGNLRWARCIVCNNYTPLDPSPHIRFEQLDAKLYCVNCAIHSKGKRLGRQNDEVLRPYVVLYDGQPGPNDFENSLLLGWDEGRVGVLKEDIANDMNPPRRGGRIPKKKYLHPPKGHSRPDTLIVVGTSAANAEIQGVIQDLSEVVREEGGKTLWISIESPPNSKVTKCFDEILLLDCQLVGYFFMAGKDFEDITKRG